MVGKILMRKLSVLVVLCPSLFACDTAPTDSSSALRMHDAIPAAGEDDAGSPDDSENQTQSASLMTCAEVFNPEQIPWLEPIAPGVGQFPPMSVSCEELLEEPNNSEVSHGQAICSWKVADYIGMELDALEFALWENDEGETVCGCRCPRCQSAEPRNEVYDAVGEGTLAAPYEIYTKEQLSDLGMNPAGWDAHYLQCDDIDLEPYYEEGGELFTIGFDSDFQISPFTGSYDGDDWEVAGYVGGDGWPSDFSALFGHVDGATLQNIVMIDPTNVKSGLAFRAEASTMRNISVEGGNASRGGIVGIMTHGLFDGGFAVIDAGDGGAFGAVTGDTIVQNVAAFGGVTGVIAGGLAGSVSGNTTVQYCEAHGNVDGLHRGGGLVGSLSGSSALVTRSFATGNVTSSSVAGGLVGRLSSATIEWSYATGDVSATNENSRAGGLVGSAATDLDGFSVSNAYATGNVTGGAASGLVTGTYYEFVEPGTELANIHYCYASGDATATAPTNPFGDAAAYAGGLTSFMPNFDQFIQPPYISTSFSTGTPTSNDDAQYSHMVGPNAWSNVAFNIEAQTGNQASQGTAASLSNGDFQNPTLPPLSMNWAEGPGAWDFSQALPTIPSAGAN